MVKTATLPLFPLNTVLFPGIPITLHIFEPRYKQMIGQCLKTRSPFGVVLIQDGVEALGPLATPHLIGCSAQIAQLQNLEQGQMNITAVGVERFRILSLDHDLPYLVGHVESYPMVEGDPAGLLPAERRLRPWVIRYLKMLADAGNVKLETADLPADTLALAYLAAYMLQIPLEQKQNLLASDQASQLLENLHQLYRQETALLTAILTDPEVETSVPFSLN